MLLSDVLISIGTSANPKNNLSMGNAEREMLSKCEGAIKSGSPVKQVKNIYGFALTQLNKAGYPYYKADKFNL